MSDKLGKFLTADEVARLFGVKSVTIYRKARSGELPAIKFGKSWIFSEDALHDWLKEQAAGKNRQDVMASLGPAFAAIPEIQLVYLFGSFALGLTTPMSDIDIAYLDDGSLDPFDLEQKIESVVLSAVPAAPRVDLMRLSTAPFTARFKVIRDGRLVYKRSDIARARFEEDTFNGYLDYAPMLVNFYKEAA
jgi:excisionase family DNA binding protein